jgi:hypothetical protein
MTDSIIIQRRFQGPANSGNGGYVCGRLASYIQGPATVRLKSPPRLETELHVHRNATGLTLLGEMTARVDQAAQAAAEHVVIGWELEREGRKHHTGTALFDAAGICIAKARATWLEVPSPA